MVLRKIITECSIDQAVALFLKECEDYGIDFQKLIHRRTGNHIQDLKYDLEHETEMGIFQSIIEYLKRKFKLDLE